MTTQADSKVMFAACPTSWRPSGADRLWPSRNHGQLSHMAGAVDDSIINIVLGIVIIIIIIIIIKLAMHLIC